MNSTGYNAFITQLNLRVIPPAPTNSFILSLHAKWKLQHSKCDDKHKVEEHELYDYKSCTMAFGIIIFNVKLTGGTTISAVLYYPAY